MKVKVMVQKLPLSKYQGYLEHVQEPEFIEVSTMYDEEKEIKTEEGSDPLAIKSYYDSENNTTMVDKKKQKSVDSGGEIQIEIDEEVHQRSLHQCDYAATDPSDQEIYDDDLQTKIEIEEDFVLKTESSDLSEFIDQCSREDVKSEDETLQEDNIYMENMNPAIRAEFFPNYD